MARTILNFNDPEFWRSTPRMISELLEIHAEFNGWKSKEEKQVCIDEIAFL